MFQDFQACWTPVLPSTALKAAPVGTMLAGEKVVLFRDSQGVARALLDRCPHRGVELSLGSVKDGQLVCPFHGWRFKGDGACGHVPYNPDARLDRLSATALPTHEEGGLLWVYTAPGLEAPDRPYVPEALLRDDVSVFMHHEEWACHWTRAMENMLDFPHLPFVHGRTIGADLKKRLTDSTPMEQRIEPQPYGFTSHTTIEGQPDARLDWMRPNGMTLHISDTGFFLRMHVWCVPTAPNRTRMLLTAVRGFGLYNPLFMLTDRFNLRILREDKAVVESSFPVEVPPPTQEQSVGSDKTTLRFRQWYFSHLKEGSQRAAS
ncbi:aromatic ring-hydroxylating dioxygenase subunit alpha [Myxococcota bacterium]|nr:aromatic ring-hydroxylating dioxygenase subunit alpha [Myxococcota bacterium]